MDEQQAPGRRILTHGLVENGPREHWRELGFPSEEDMLDWQENHRPGCTPWRWSFGTGARAVALAVTAFTWGN
jgi:hypothetical protein